MTGVNTPLGFIGAMFEPCESKGQALVTAGCMTVLAAGGLAVAWALFHLGEGFRETIAEFDLGTRRGRSAEGDMAMYMLGAYAGCGIAALFALLMLTCAVIAPVRTLFPKGRTRKERVLR